MTLSGAALYQDLLGRPFMLGGENPSSGIDCWYVTRTILERLGLEAPPLIPTIGDERAQECTRAGLARGAEKIATGWAPALARVGDVVEAIIEQPGVLGFGPPRVHLAPIVSLGPPLALHAARRVGAYCAAPNAIGRVVALWRFPGAPGAIPSPL